MKSFIRIIAIMSLSASSYAVNSESVNIHDFYRLEVPTEELPLKSIARILLSTEKAKGEKYEENIANRITKFRDNIDKISSKTYTPVSIDFDKASNILSDQIIGRYNEILEADDREVRLNEDKKRNLKWKIRYILLVKHLHTLTETYYKLKESGNSIKSCNEITDDGINVCINSIDSIIIEYNVIARNPHLVYQTQYTFSRVNDEWVMTAILMDPSMLTNEFYASLAYLK